MNVTDLFRQYKAETAGDIASAALLTLATIMDGGERPGGPLTVRQAAERRGVSVDLIYDACREGRLRHRRVGRAIRIDAADVDNF
jgi:excisionase family DNA binding protein